MLRRFLKFVFRSLSRKPVAHSHTYTFTAEDIFRGMGSCALNRKPFDAGLLHKQTRMPIFHEAQSVQHLTREVRTPHDFVFAHVNIADSSTLAVALPPQLNINWNHR